MSAFASHPPPAIGSSPCPVARALRSRIGAGRFAGVEMAISLSLMTCNLSDAFREGTNPFTGEKVRFPLDHGLTADEHRALFQILSELRAEGPDDDRYHYIRFSPEHCLGIDAGSETETFPKRGFAVEKWKAPSTTTSPISYGESRRPRTSRSGLPAPPT